MADLVEECELESPHLRELAKSCLISPETLEMRLSSLPLSQDYNRIPLPTEVSTSNWEERSPPTKFTKTDRGGETEQSFTSQYSKEVHNTDPDRHKLKKLNKKRKKSKKMSFENFKEKLEKAKNRYITGAEPMEECEVVIEPRVLLKKVKKSSQDSIKNSSKSAEGLYSSDELSEIENKILPSGAISDRSLHSNPLLNSASIQDWHDLKTPKRQYAMTKRGGICVQMPERLSRRVISHMKKNIGMNQLKETGVLRRSSPGEGLRRSSKIISSVVMDGPALDGIMKPGTSNPKPQKKHYLKSSALVASLDSFERPEKNRDDLILVIQGPKSLEKSNLSQSRLRPQESSIELEQSRLKVLNKHVEMKRNKLSEQMDRSRLNQQKIQQNFEALKRFQKEFAAKIKAKSHFRKPPPPQIQSLTNPNSQGDSTLKQRYQGLVKHSTKKLKELQLQQQQQKARLPSRWFGVTTSTPEKVNRKNIVKSLEGSSDLKKHHKGSTKRSGNLNSNATTVVHSPGHMVMVTPKKIQKTFKASKILRMSQADQVTMKSATNHPSLSRKGDRNAKNGKMTVKRRYSPETGDRGSKNVLSHTLGVLDKRRSADWHQARVMYSAGKAKVPEKPKNHPKPGNTSAKKVSHYRGDWVRSSIKNKRNSQLYTSSVYVGGSGKKEQSQVPGSTGGSREKRAFRGSLGANPTSPKLYSSVNKSPGALPSKSSQKWRQYQSLDRKVAAGINFNMRASQTNNSRKGSGTKLNYQKDGPIFTSSLAYAGSPRDQNLEEAANRLVRRAAGPGGRGRVGARGSSLIHSVGDLGRKKFRNSLNDKSSNGAQSGWFHAPAKNYVNRGLSGVNTRFENFFSRGGDQTSPSVLNSSKVKSSAQRGLSTQVVSRYQGFKPQNY